MQRKPNKLIQGRAQESVTGLSAKMSISDGEMSETESDNAVCPKCGMEYTDDDGLGSAVMDVIIGSTCDVQIFYVMMTYQTTIL